MAVMWEAGEPGVVELPSGRRVRGAPLSSVGHVDHLAVLRGRRPALDLPHTWIRWPDFGLPSDQDAALAALREILERAGRERVQLSCRGGRGRTGTALAALAVLDGLPSTAAVAWVRSSYHRRAVETPWQRRWVERLRP